MENIITPPRVDIALATYNGSRFIEPLLASLRAQTHAPVRIYVSDDGSRDKTIDLLRASAELMDLRIVPYAPSGNILRNFENAISATDAPYVALCDQDDVWHPQKIELLLARMRELELAHGSETPLLVFCDLEIVDAELATIHPSFFGSTIKSSRARTFRDFALNNHAPGCATLMNRALIDLALPFPDLDIHDHWLIQLATLSGHVDCVDMPLIRYRQHGSNSIGLGMSSEGSAFLTKYRRLMKSILERSGLWRQRSASARKNMTALLQRLDPDRIAAQDKRLIDAVLKPATILTLGSHFRGAHSGEREIDKLGVLWTISRGR